ncbi:glycosyltransferase [Cyanobacterium sp. DS4]|uniref:glycosyltransferase n=1 Tax=Cyanobacterium sp. DS4 TaxID=2878255 RepID=UPI002E80F84E|nr:glycosyltransferase [Cyanobacterium sp. Dongsha4]WVK99939.1 glycosyltransferase [Cyanobacterium sp. Dongsha4]
MINVNKVENSLLFVVCQTGRGNGGVESITLVIERLKKFNPIILTNLDLPMNKRWENLGIKVYLLPSLHDPSPKKNIFLPYFLQEIIRWLKNNLYLYRFIKKSQVKIVHFNDIQGAFQGIIPSKLTGTKIVFNIRDTKKPSETYNWKWHLVTQLSDQILVLSQEMKTYIQNALKIKKQEKINYIYSSVNVERFYPISPENKKELRSNLGIDEATFAIGYIASVNPKKNQLELIRNGAKLLKSNIPKSKLYLVGDFQPAMNPYAKKCEETVAKLELQDYIDFVGYCSTVEQWYQALDIIIVVSIREGLARCMIESLTCGTPVVSFAVCSAKEILQENKCGEVVELNDYKSLADNVSKLSKNPALLNQMRKQSITVARNLFSEYNVNQYEEIYLNLQELTINS